MPITLLLPPPPGFSDHPTALYWDVPYPSRTPPSSSSLLAHDFCIIEIRTEQIFALHNTYTTFLDAVETLWAEEGKMHRSQLRKKRTT